MIVVGMGEDGPSGLAPAARKAIEEADLLIGTERLLALVPTGLAERRAANPGANEALDLIETNQDRRQVVVLASGDPGFFGVGQLLVRRFGKERVEILPHLSCVQLAFARIKESWEDATFLSVHGRSAEGLVRAVRGGKKVAILTDERNSPGKIARTLIDAGLSGYRAYLCEELGGSEERVREVTLEELQAVQASPLNVLVLIRTEAEAQASFGRRRHGIPDGEFHQRRPRRGLITKLEVRAVALALLGLDEGSVVWDVGAGTGAVAVEAALLSRHGEVYAVERDPEAVELIRSNVAMFNVLNVVVIPGSAPEALSDLPDPDAVFVGGSGGRLAEILETASRQLRQGGRIVVSCASLETATSSTVALRELGFAVEVTLIQASRGKDLAGLTHLEGLNPVFLVAGQPKSGTGSGEHGHSAGQEPFLSEMPC